MKFLLINEGILNRTQFIIGEIFVYLASFAVFFMYYNGRIDLGLCLLWSTLLWYVDLTIIAKRARDFSKTPYNFIVPAFVLYPMNLLKSMDSTGEYFGTIAHIYCFFIVANWITLGYLLFSKGKFHNNKTNKNSTSKNVNDVKIRRYITDKYTQLKNAFVLIKKISDDFFFISYLKNKRIIKLCILIGTAVLFYVLMKEGRALLRWETWAESGAYILFTITCLFLSPLLILYIPIFLFVLPVKFFVNKGMRRLCLSLSCLVIFIISFVNYEYCDDMDEWLEESWWQFIIAAYLPSLIGYVGIWIYKGFKMNEQLSLEIKK